MSKSKECAAAQMHGVVIVPIQWVYEHLICEFTHWDICLTGLVDRDGEYWFCLVRDPHSRQAEYEIRKVNWTTECDEFLSDYRVAYKHWFHEGKPRCGYNGWPLGWFAEKWDDRNPIEEQSR